MENQKTINEKFDEIAAKVYAHNIADGLHKISLDLLSVDYQGITIDDHLTVISLLQGIDGVIKKLPQLEDKA